MKNVIDFLVDFGLIFTIMSIVYLFYLKKKKGSYSKLKKNETTNVFIRNFDLDYKKIGYKKILYTVGLINTFSISFVSTVIVRINNIFISVLVSVVLILIILLSLYQIAGRLFKKMEEK